jgi:hypothetical protein
MYSLDTLDAIRSVEVGWFGNETGERRRGPRGRPFEPSSEEEQKPGPVLYYWRLDPDLGMIEVYPGDPGFEEIAAELAKQASSEG